MNVCEEILQLFNSNRILMKDHCTDSLTTLPSLPPPIPSRSDGHQSLGRIQRGIGILLSRDTSYLKNEFSNLQVSNFCKILSYF